MIEQKYKNIVWDWNGTLLDDVDTGVRTLADMLARRGLCPLSLEEYKAQFGFPVEEFYHKVGFDMEKESMHELSVDFVETYDKFAGHLALNPEVRETLAAFQEAGKRQYILSALREELLKPMTQEFGINTYFEGICGSDNIYAAGKIERGLRMLANYGIAPSETLMIGDTLHDAEVANRLGYPVLVRPSYVLGGQGMQIAISDEDIEEFMEIINRIAQDHPILVDKYLQGKEIEVDAVCDGADILIPGIMEHIERTGVHSGDSISVYPAPTINQTVKEKIAEYTRRLAKALHVKGLINIQFIAIEDEVYVIEVNPRSSRTVPYISKVTGIPIVDLAAQVMIGKTIKELGYEPGLQPEAEYFAIKMPVFSFEKIRGAEISLGPEMKSTGECLGIARTFNEALYKAFLGAGVNLPKYKNMIITVKDADKGEAIEIGRRFEKLGYTIYATRSTAAALNEAGVKARKVNKISQESPTVMDLILGHKIDLVIDTPTQGRDKSRDGFLIRRTAIETGVHCITAMDTARALVTSLENAGGQLTLVDVAQL